jgi:hypothetical protein
VVSTTELLAGFLLGRNAHIFYGHTVFCYLWCDSRGKTGYFFLSKCTSSEIILFCF